jgi:hypothetical protein
MPGSCGRNCPRRLTVASYSHSLQLQASCAPPNNESERTPLPRLRPTTHARANYSFRQLVGRAAQLATVRRAYYFERNK